MNKTFICIICSAAMILVSCKERDGAGPAMTAQNIVGTAKITAGGIDRDLKAGDTIAIGEIILTGDKSIADIVYAETGYIRVYEQSRVMVQALVTPSNADTRLFMNRGKLFLILGKLKNGTFAVDTPTLVVSVTGTSFRVIAGERKTKLDVLAGKVKVIPVSGGIASDTNAQDVAANQTLEADTTTAETAVREKRNMPLAALTPQEFKAIAEEVRSISDEVIEKIDPDSRKELKYEVLKLPGAVQEEMTAPKTVIKGQVEDPSETLNKDAPESSKQDMDTTAKQELENKKEQPSDIPTP